MSNYLLALPFAMLFMTACGLHLQQFSRVSIDDRPGWTVVQKCGSGACYPSNDYLVAKDITIRVDARNHIPQYIERDIFVIAVLFPDGKTQNIEFDPSLSTAELQRRRLFHAKGVACGGTTVLDRSYVLSAPAVSGYQRITRAKYCFFLFFDTSPPSVKEVFVLNLKGVRRHGQIVDVPRIVFRPGKG
jgi:hypothetical protein